MSTLNQPNFQSIKRSLSYNDLKKKRMQRSASNRGKLATITNKTDHANQTIQNVSKICKISSNHNFTYKLPQIIQQIDNNKDIRTGKIKDCAHKYSHQQQNNNFAVQPRTLGCKKMKSMRILTKVSTKNFTSTTKFNTDLLKRIEKIKVDVSDTLKEKYHTQNINKCQNFALTSNNNIKIKQQSEKQNIFFNAISPIQQKHQRKSINNLEEISGFSILNDIQEKSKQEQSLLPNILKDKLKITNFDSKNFHGVDLEHDIKMPKISKRHLPKDFFLRV